MKLKLRTKQRIASAIQLTGFGTFATGLIVAAAVISLPLGAVAVGAIIIAIGVIIDIYQD